MSQVADLKLLPVQSLSQSPGYTFFKLSMIANPKFAVGISILTIVVPATKIFPLLASTLPFPVPIVVSIACEQLLEACCSQKPRSAVGIWMLPVIFPETDICISGFGGHITISSVNRCRNSLKTASSSSA